MYGAGVEYSCSVTGKGAERTVGGASLLENGMVLTCADAGSKKRTVLHRWHREEICWRLSEKSPRAIERNEITCDSGK